MSYNVYNPTTGQLSVVADKSVVMTGATANAAGTAGYVPVPGAGDQNKVLKGDGTWGTVNTDSYTAGYGIDITNGVISSKTFTGTTAMWEALSASQQAAFDYVNLTDDYDEASSEDIREATLVAGATYVDFPNLSGNVLVDVGTTLSSLEYNDIVPYGTGVRVTFDAQTSDVKVYLTVKEV